MNDLQIFKSWRVSNSWISMNLPKNHRYVILSLCCTHSASNIDMKLVRLLIANQTILWNSLTFPGSPGFPDSIATLLLVKFYHLKFLHTSAQLIKTAMKQMHWIVGANSVIHKEVRKCIICAWFLFEFSKQIMSNLPSSRVNSRRAFLICGTGFCELFLISHQMAE